MNYAHAWILKGYEVFAIEGPAALKIERLAKMVGKSKSSFYHYFADMEIFMEALLDYHIQQSHIIAQKERSAVQINPELIEILVEHKTDLLFSRQLRFNKNVPHYFKTLMLSNKIVGDSMVDIWLKDLEVNLTEKQVKALFSLALENFFLEINADHLEYQWLLEYFNDLKSKVKNIV